MWFTMVSLAGQTCHNLSKCNNQSQNSGHCFSRKWNNITFSSTLKFPILEKIKCCHKFFFKFLSSPDSHKSQLLNPSTWLASFSINEYWYKLQHTIANIRIKDKLKQSPSTRTHTCSFNYKKNHATRAQLWIVSLKHHTQTHVYAKKSKLVA
jgi:hypothetical protein